MQDIHAAEDARLAALARYDVLDSPREEAFDRITRLVRNIFRVSMSTVTLIDGHRQWFKSRDGVVDQETSRRPAFCTFAIGQPDPLVVSDAHGDNRFRDNEFVNGAPHIRFYAGVQLCTPDGHAIGTLCAMDTQPRPFPDQDLAILRDLAATVMRELDLRLASTQDGLTGVLSRHALREHGEQVLALAIRYRNPLSCILFDLDHFKAVNDTHGHATGDRVLVQAAKACRETLRKSDILGRVGGEEFCILLPHTSRDAAVNVAEKARRRIAATTVESGGSAVPVSASFGIAELDLDAADLEAALDDLFRRADMAMYEAKRAGRNRCAVASEHRASPGPAKSRRVFKAGLITFDTGRSTFDCTVRSLSDEGAILDVVDAGNIPAAFKLQILSEGVSRRCEVLDRRGRQLDVAFK